MKKLGFIFIFVVSLARVSYCQTNSFEMSKNLDIYVSLLNELNVNYADDIYPSELIKNSIDGMLEKLDPYTVYITESEIEDVKFLTTGEYGGIGALILERDGAVYISEVYDNTPAQKHGLKSGDKIVSVDKKNIDEKNSIAVSDMMKGQAGTVCNISVERAGIKGVLSFDIKREQIKLDNVSYSGVFPGEIGYVKLDRFANDAAKEVLNAFVQLKEKNKLNGFVLDLRGNGGGLLNEAVDICNIFVPRGKLIVSIKGKQMDRNQSYYTANDAIDMTIPLIVLVDEQSASASEIVAGAIQDLDRGVIIGAKTFGKGLVQNILPLPFNAQLKITTAKYYIPSGRCIQKVDYFKHDKGADQELQDNGESYTIDSSLLKYKTMNGRVVLGGGGITPDIILDMDSGDEFTAFLIINFYMFDYAVRYANTHAIGNLDEFVITNEIFNDFVNYLMTDRNISFRGESEELFSEFCENVKKAGDYERLESYIEEMNKAITIPLKEHFEKNKEEIKKALYISMVTAMYSNKESYRVLLQKDKDVEKALELIKDKAKMVKLLKK